MKNKTGIIDLGLGNIRSVFNALEYLDGNPVYISSSKDLNKINRLVFPGVGSFDYGMKLIRSSDIFDNLSRFVTEKKMPFMGICLGMQLIFEGSDEGKSKGLCWLKGEFKKFVPKDKFSIPHIGWNKVKIINDGKLLQGLGKENFFYFVHSFFLEKKNYENFNSLSFCNYINEFISSFEIENIFCCQFHPEKSQMSGLKLVSNFLNVK